MTTSPSSRMAVAVRSIRFRLALMVTAALLITAGVLVLGVNVAVDTVAAPVPREQPTTLEDELARILGLSISELGSSGGTSATDALLDVECAGRHERPQPRRQLL